MLPDNRTPTANGISIPSQYVSYVAPLSSSKLFNDAAAFGDEEHMETPYVVKFRSVFSITDPQALWSFDHPTKSAIRPQGHPHFNVHNNRYSKATFSVSQDAVMVGTSRAAWATLLSGQALTASAINRSRQRQKQHGIAGYFEATLYKDVKVSIHPETHSKDMFSWFPIFFPIRVPLFLPRGSEVTVHFWRATDTRKVWYEWCVVPTINGVEVVGEASAIHNPGGKSYWIGL
nr:Protein arginine N-methyltransferase 5 [Polyrhizophydium stewartii]